MPKYTFQWKDPSYYDGDPAFEGSKSIAHEEWDKFRKLGIGEYLLVEVDTDAMTVEVKK